jgi:hypothetical protein
MIGSRMIGAHAMMVVSAIAGVMPVSADHELSPDVRLTRRFCDCLTTT